MIFAPGFHLMSAMYSMSERHCHHQPAHKSSCLRAAACAYAATCLCLVSTSMAACHARARAVRRIHERVRCWMHVRKDVMCKHIFRRTRTCSVHVCVYSRAYQRVLNCFVYVSMSLHAGAISIPPHPRARSLSLSFCCALLTLTNTSKTQCRGRRCVRGGGAGFSQESEQGNRGEQDHQRVTARLPAA